MPKTKNCEDRDKDAPAFEDALSQLEELVREMESDQMPLEELIKNYEKGTRLFKVCEKRLDEAQGRIEIIRKNRSGQGVVEPFGDQEAEKGAVSAEKDESDEHGELF
ncbi:MAG: exodeoxyribonuclease VII small subunit [Verrucomicrobiales bacterium]|nr:exodeoxyribonuclease VII small subunit [Verrucomicrobiales bacterium]